MILGLHLVVIVKKGKKNLRPTWRAGTGSDGTAHWRGWNDTEDHGDRGDDGTYPREYDTIATLLFFLKRSEALLYILLSPTGYFAGAAPACFKHRLHSRYHSRQ